MIIMKNIIIGKLISLMNEGILWIFGSSLVAQFCGLVSSIIVIRNLEKIDYGHYVDASNVYGYIAIFVGMGLTSAVLQFCSEKRDIQEKINIYKYSLIEGTLFNFLLSGVVVVIAVVKGYFSDSSSATYLMYMCGLPIVAYFNAYVQIVLRINLFNREFGIVNIAYSLSVVSGNIIFTIIWGIPGLILSNYLSNCIAAVVGIFIIKKKSILKGILDIKVTLGKKQKKSINEYALLCSITNFSSAVLVLLDITCLSIVLKDAEVLANYKVGSVIPAACIFVPTCLMTFFYPKIVQMYCVKLELFRRYLYRLTTLFCSCCFCVTIVLLLGSDFIIGTIYGDQYLASVPIMRILSINFLISGGLRKLYGNIIAVFRKVHINLLFSIVSGVLNIGLDILLISNFHSIGAAIATLSVTCFITVLEMIYVFSFLKECEKHIAL